MVLQANWPQPISDQSRHLDGEDVTGGSLSPWELETLRVTERETDRDRHREWWGERKTQKWRVRENRDIKKHKTESHRFEIVLLKHRIPCNTVTRPEWLSNNVLVGGVIHDITRKDKQAIHYLSYLFNPGRHCNFSFVTSTCTLSNTLLVRSENIRASLPSR